MRLTAIFGFSSLNGDFLRPVAYSTDLYVNRGVYLTQTRVIFVCVYRNSARTLVRYACWHSNQKCPSICYAKPRPTSSRKKNIIFRPVTRSEWFCVANRGILSLEIRTSESLTGGPVVGFLDLDKIHPLAFLLNCNQKSPSIRCAKPTTLDRPQGTNRYLGSKKKKKLVEKKRQSR